MSEFHNLLVTGGRGYANRLILAQVLTAAKAALDEKLGFKNVRLHHGGAKGADSLAAEYASLNGWGVVERKADWDEHGRAAGPIRNQQMVDWSNAVLCISFPGGVGTADCVKRAVEAGIPHYAVPSGFTTNDELTAGIKGALNG